MTHSWDDLRIRLGFATRNVWDGAATRRSTWSRFVSDSLFWYVQRGRGWIETRTAGRVEMRPGVCLCMAPGWDYDATQDVRRPLTVLCVHFELIDAHGHVLPFDHTIVPEILHVPDVAYTSAGIERVVNLMHGLFAANPVFHPDRMAIAGQLFRGMLMDLCAASEGARAVAPGTQTYQYDLMLDVVRKLTDNPRDLPRVAEMARQCGYSLPHFSRVFKRVIGQSPKTFVTELRMNIARQLLRESDLTISEIADNLGFDSVAYFSRLFKAKWRMTASEFRKRAGR